MDMRLKCILCTTSKLFGKWIALSYINNNALQNHGNIIQYI
jgi:hypothetical protein